MGFEQQFQNIASKSKMHQLIDEMEDGDSGILIVGHRASEEDESFSFVTMSCTTEWAYMTAHRFARYLLGLVEAKSE